MNTKVSRFASTACSLGAALALLAACESMSEREKGTAKSAPAAARWRAR